jgi:hypothetical protein
MPVLYIGKEALKIQSVQEQIILNRLKLSDIALEMQVMFHFVSAKAQMVTIF